MRDFLTGLAILLIIVLTTVLVAPYLVDWNGQRDFLEARLSHALGQKVTIGGNIDLKVLPTPYLVLDQVVVGDEDGPVRIGVHHLDLELTVAPLLHGAFDITEARLEEPTIRVNLESDRSLPALPKAPAFQADVRFDKVQLRDGTLAVSDPQSGRTFTFDHIDLDADAAAFTGPFKINGAAGAPGQRTPFHLATGTPEKTGTHARLIVEETADHAGLDLDGTLAFASAGKTSIRHSFRGTLALAGRLAAASHSPTEDAPTWKLSGPVEADTARVVLDNGEFQLGVGDSTLALRANAELKLDETPQLALDLAAKQLDIDRLAGAPVDATRPTPPHLPDLATLRRMVEGATPPVPTRVTFACGNATWGGETLSDLQALIGFGPERQAQPLKLAGDGPGGSHIAIDGQLKPGPAFAGTVDLEADNLPRAIDWLGSVAPSIPWKPSDAPFKRVKAAGYVTASPDAVDAVRLALTLDRSSLKGSVDLARGEGAQPGKLTADLKADALDIDGLPRLDTLRGSQALDLDLRLDAKAIKVSRVGDGALDTGHMTFALAKTGPHLELKDFRADDLGGATIRATGALDRDKGNFALTLDAAKLDAVAGLVRQLAPGPVADALVARAPALAPAQLQIDGALVAADGGGLAPTTLSAKGKLGDTRLDAHAEPATGGSDITAVSGVAEAPNGSVLLAQLGLPALPMDVLGKGRIDLTAKGKTGEPLDTKVAAAFGSTKLQVAGRYDLLSLQPRGGGTAQLASPDLTPLLQSLAVAFPDLTGTVPVDVAGQLKLGDDGWEVDDLKGRVAGVGTAGSLRYRRADKAQPALTGQLKLDSLRLASLVGLALGPEQQTAPDAAWSKQPFAVGLIDPPHAAVTLAVDRLAITPGVEATGASLDLTVAPNVVTLTNAKADLAYGRITGGATLRRDGRQASVEGKVALDKVAVRLPAAQATVSGKLDFAGGGGTALALVSSLAGSGEASVAELHVPQGDPRALQKIFEDVEADDLTIDQGAIVRAVDDAAKAPLYLDARGFDLGLASGVVRFDPKEAPRTDDAVASKVDASFDLPRMRFDERLEETLHALPKNWSGAPPVLAVSLSGPVDAPKREVDVSGFINAVAARAVARETARIEAYEFDIRERAFFNARLQSEKRREEERKKAEDDARRAEAERKARLEAARLERQRREAAAKAAREANPPDASPPAPPVGAQPPVPTGDPSSLGRY